jgi:hypothetical protein
MPFAINSSYVLQKVSQRGDRAYQINRTTEQLKKLQEQAGMQGGQGGQGGEGADPSDAFATA